VEFVTTSSIVMKLALNQRNMLSQQTMLKIVLKPTPTVKMEGARVQQLLIHKEPLLRFKAVFNVEPTTLESEPCACLLLNALVEISQIMVMEHANVQIQP
jgi:hypothetical protein